MCEVGTLLSETEAEDIKKTKKDCWKQCVKERIIQKSIQELSDERSQLKKGRLLPEYEEMKLKDYFLYLKPEDARTMFRIRSEMYDIKALQKHKYEDSKCRLCGSESEDMDHVLNRCVRVEKNNNRHVNLVAEDEETCREIISRIRSFEDNLEAINSKESSLIK